MRAFTICMLVALTVNGTALLAQKPGEEAKPGKHQRRKRIGEHIVLETQDGLAGPRITLAAATSEKLAVNSRGVVEVDRYHMQAAALRDAYTQGYVRATPGHVGGDHNALRLTRQCHDLTLTSVLVGIEDLRYETMPFQDPLKLLGLCHRSGSD